MINIERKLNIMRCILLSLLVAVIVAVIFISSTEQEKQNKRTDFIMTYDNFVTTS